MKLFGTDGIRSEYNNFPMIDKDLIKIGYCFAKSMFGNNYGRIFIGNDGRESSTDILNSLNTGISQQGSDVISVGLLPTPALSTRTRPQTRNLVRHRPTIIDSIRPHNHLIAFPRSFL